MAVTRYGTYKFKCLICGDFKHTCAEFTQRAACPTCGELAVRVFEPRPPVIRRSKFHFRRADTYQEALNTARYMEDSGQFHNNPALEAQVRSRVEQLKEMPEKERRIDYDKTGGHPVLDQE